MHDEIWPAVYMVASGYRGTIDTGVTIHLFDRITARKQNLFPGRPADDSCNQLVWYENHETMAQAIRREAQIKRWKLKRKIELIEEFNRDWQDLHNIIEYRPYTG